MQVQAPHEQRRASFILCTLEGKSQVPGGVFEPLAQLAAAVLAQFCPCCCCSAGLCLCHRRSTSLARIYRPSDLPCRVHIKQHYFRSHPTLNPYGVVPLGAPGEDTCDDFRKPHGREAIAGIAGSGPASA